MIRIAIVDDIIEICSSLERILLHYAEKIDEKIEVEPYTSSETFFSALDNNETFDLIYLDIEIDNKTGIDIANHIRSVMDDELQQIVTELMESISRRDFRKRNGKSLIQDGF